MSTLRGSNRTDTKWRCSCSRKDGKTTCEVASGLDKNGVGYVERWSGGHVTAAVSCCLEMALWRALWMAGQVSRMASGGFSASFMRLLMNFFGVASRAASSLQAERDKVDVWISVKFGLFSSLGHVTWMFAGCSNEGGVAGKRSHNGDIQVRGGTVEAENKVHARVLPLTVHDTSEIWNGLFDVHLGATV